MEPEEGISSKIRKLEAENRRLRRAVEELSILNEVASAVTSTSSLNTIVDLIVQKCMKHLSVEQGAVLLFDEKAKDGALRTMVRRVQTDLKPIPYRLSDQISGWVIKHQAPLVINNLASDERFRVSLESGYAIESLLCVPLRLKGRMIGVLTVVNKQSPEGFTESDQRLLTIIAAQSAQVIENARLYEEEQALRLMQQELRMALDIQRNLLPDAPPDIPAYEIAGKTVPARNVGGDYFDFLSFGENRFAICLADVSGKGMPAALLMANVQATIRGQSLLESSAGESLERCNRLLYESTDSEKFVTMFYAILDTARHELRYSNAGHDPPLLFSEGSKPQRLTAGGPVLGVLPACRFEEAAVSLEPGDLLVIYSDGFSEGMNPGFEEFGQDRLIETLFAHRDEKADLLINSIYAAVKEHSAGAPQTDDMTMVVVRRKE